MTKPTPGFMLSANEQEPSAVTMTRHFPRPTFLARLKNLFWPRPNHVYVCFHFKPNTPGGAAQWDFAEAWVQTANPPAQTSLAIKCWQNGQVVFQNFPDATIINDKVYL